MAEVEQVSWPTRLAATEADCLARIEAFAEGQWVAVLANRVVGASTAQRITSTFLEAKRHSYREITDNGQFTNSHHPDGEIYQLIGVSVLPEFRGDQFGRRLVDQQIDFARSLPDVRRILGFTRPAGYHRHRDLAIEEYITRRDDKGMLLDSVLAFHLDAGAKIVSVCPGFRPEDRESFGYGVLIEYPIL